jgi:NTP pyrophosphatase (non-canonical NTP hydrolase)
MRFTEYQAAAEKTDQAPLNQEDKIKPLMIPLLGLAGESGSLLTEYKKYLRDGDSYKIFHERISEELGDILWYVANIATKAGLDLGDIAENNLSKVADRWHEQSSQLFGSKLFDDDYPTHEQFPRTFEIVVATERGSDGKPHVQLFYNNRRLGDELTDNSYEDDGYRLHDVFHLGFLVDLGWSPVLRRREFFNCKRKSRRDVDEIQDGGRAAVIDEAIAALIFVEAKRNSFFEGVDSVSYELLRTVKELTAHLEVGRCSAKQWEMAILQGFRVWRALRTHGRGVIKADLLNRTLEFLPSSH